MPTVSVLVVAGGGQGASDGGGGGGGGGIIDNPTVTIAAVGTFTVTVGAGGSSGGVAAQGANGSDSVFDTLTAPGGGGGGKNGSAGSAGGSGGGGAYGATAGGAATGAIGFAGGAGAAVRGGGGGGGSQAGAVGGASGGKGGDGYTSSISGASVVYGGGGGGSQAGAGGTGGGGAGHNTTPVAGTVNTGGGGGGEYNGGSAGAAGGSGTVIVSYPTGTIVAVGGTITTSGGNTIHTFTASSAFVVSVPSTPAIQFAEDPLAPDWGQIDKGNPKAVSDALFTIWQLIHPSPVNPSQLSQDSQVIVNSQGNLVGDANFRYLPAVGGVGIGPINPVTGQLLYLSSNDGNTRKFVIDVADGTAAFQPRFAFRRSRGTVSPLNRSAVQASDLLGLMEWMGWDGASFVPAAYIDCLVDGTPGTADMPGALRFWTTPDGSSTPVERLRISQGGLIRMSVYGAGTATFDASGNISSVSDERLKDIQGLFAAGLGELLGLRPIRYRYRRETGLDTENIYVGFSAQNVMALIPEAVGKGPDGMYTLSDRTILAAVVNAVQTLEAEIRNLRAAQGLPPIDRPTIRHTGEERLVLSRPRAARSPLP